jgi:hypothetical protein
MVAFNGKIARLALAAVLSTSAATVALAEDKHLIVFDWSGYELPECWLSRHQPPQGNFAGQGRFPSPRTFMMLSALAD